MNAADPTDRRGIVPNRSSYRHFLAIPTRWADNDQYGHVNNVTYYAYFDTVVNAHLIHAGGLDIQAADVVGLVVETFCRFRKSLSFPDVVDAGMRVAHLGNASVRYEIGLFRATEDDAAADGHFVHVWVERASQRPVRIPARIREALASLLVEGAQP
ncbi:MAG: thioesterase family protein [Casimicrobiaceae bacterium]